MHRVHDYTPYFTQTSLARKPSPLRELWAHMGTPGMISLGTGLPNPSMFPFSGAKFTLNDGTEMPLDDEIMQEALQYSATPGLPLFVDWLMNLQMHVHNPPNKDDVKIIVSTGSQDVLAMTFQMLVERGDHVLVESPTYSGVLSILQPMGCHLHGIQTDNHGLLPSALQTKLDGWPIDVPKPKFLYIIPNGANPTGMSLTLERRQQIYAIARRHNLLILEDDAYYYVQFSSERPPSFLSMDVDGRVLRFDTFSKIISSGLRLGFATGPQALIHRLTLHAQATYLHASGLSQAVLLGLLSRWGIQGFLEHTNKVSEFYYQRCNVFQSYLEKHLTGLAEWSTPSAGMFFWIRIIGVDDTMKLIKEKAVKKLVLLVPGTAFMPNEEKSPYVRASFSIATDEEMDLALKRLAELIRETQVAPSMGVPAARF